MKEEWTPEYWAAMGWLLAQNHLWYCEYDGDLLDLVENGELPPAPFSGEFSGGSIPELFGVPVGGEWPSDELLAELEEAYTQAFVGTLTEAKEKWEATLGHTA
jgi:hypothetical protein